MGASNTLQSRAQALLDLYEPVFQKVCLLSRTGRKADPAQKKGGGDDYETSREEIKGLLRAGLPIRKDDPLRDHLLMQARKLERPLVYFIDSMVSRSNLDFRDVWKANLLAVEWYGQAARGNVEFFHDVGGLAAPAQENTFAMLGKDLDDPSDDASERLAVFYICLGLGFTGTYDKDPKTIQEYMERTRRRVKHLQLLESDLGTRISGDAYHAETVNGQGEREWRKVIIMGILFLCFTAATIKIYVEMFKDAADDLRQAVNIIHKQADH